MRYLTDLREVEKEGMAKGILGNVAASWEAELAVMCSRGKRENGRREGREVGFGAVKETKRSISVEDCI